MGPYFLQTVVRLVIEWNLKTVFNESPNVLSSQKFVRRSIQHFLDRVNVFIGLTNLSNERFMSLPIHVDS
jgi:hypothetical protein